MGKQVKLLISFLIIIILGVSVYFLTKNYENQENEIISAGKMELAEELPRYDAGTQAQFATFIRENINMISPEPAVLGGTFYVTNLNWQRSNLATVDYEDGHIALRAEVELDLTENGEIVVSNVNLITPPDSLNSDNLLPEEDQPEADADFILEAEVY